MFYSLQVVMNEDEKSFDLRIRAAERAHDVERKGAEIHNGQIEVFANAAMRAPALVAAGGLAAALAFYSANHAAIIAKQGALDQFSGVLVWLLTALLLTVIAPGMAYFSQLAYLDSNHARSHHYDSPFVRSGRRSKIADIVGDICRWIAVSIVLASIASVTMGGISLLRLISVLG
jgi:hypothetical protein